MQVDDCRDNRCELILIEELARIISEAHIPKSN